jgi:hypothetical protein
VKIDAREQWVMIRAEYARPPVARMFIQPMNSSFSDAAPAIPDQDIVQNQARQGVKSVPPPRERWGDPEAEPRFAEQAPGPLVPAASKIEIGPKNYSIVGHGAQQVTGL